MKEGIAVLGSLNADLVVRVARFPDAGETVVGNDFEVFPGGKGANQACAAARLGARVRMLGRVGDDDHGRLLERSLQAAGVDTSRVARDAAPTGTALIEIDAAGQNRIVIVPGANGRVTPRDVERWGEAIAGAAFLLLQLEVRLDAVVAAARLARDAGTVVILDPAPARAEAWPLLAVADYVTPNETELRTLAQAGGPVAPDVSTSALARRLLAGGAGHAVTKLGAQGARLVSADVELRWPGLPVKAVDTTAAGDVWNGAFATALAAGADRERAGAFANAAAALSVTRLGAQPGMPDRAEVEAFMKQREGR